MNMTANMTPSEMLKNWDQITWDQIEVAHGIIHQPTFNKQPVQLKLSGLVRSFNPRFKYESEAVEKYNLSLSLGGSRDGVFDFEETKALVEINSRVAEQAEEASLTFKPLVNCYEFSGTTAYGINCTTKFNYGTRRSQLILRGKYFSAEGRKVELTSDNLNSRVQENDRVKVLVDVDFFQGETFCSRATIVQMKLDQHKKSADVCLL